MVGVSVDAILMTIVVLFKSRSTKNLNSHIACIEASNGGKASDIHDIEHGPCRIGPDVISGPLSNGEKAKSKGALTYYD